MVNKCAASPALKSPSPGVLDRRLNAYRPDLADERLRGKVQAAAFTRGRQARIIAPVADLFGVPPQIDAEGNIRQGAASQLLYGARVTVFDCRAGWAWVQAAADSYTGYVREDSLEIDGNAALTPTHRIAAPRTFLYCEADLRSAPTAALSMGSVLTISGEAETRGTRYALLPSGEAVIANHLQPLAQYAADYVSIAESLLRTPYLWGGASAFGIDCSGLVQLSMAMTGHQVPRDSDMQAASIGEPLDIVSNTGDLSALRRGDLIFWRGHVAIMRSESEIIHANGTAMSVSIEPPAAAIARIAARDGSRPTAFRRP